MVNTSDEADLAYLTALMERNAEYRRLNLPSAPLCRAVRHPKNPGLMASLDPALLLKLELLPHFDLRPDTLAPPQCFHCSSLGHGGFSTIVSAFADKVELGSTDACWSAVIAQLEPNVYYVKIDDDVVYIQVQLCGASPPRSVVLTATPDCPRMQRVAFQQSQLSVVPPGLVHRTWRWRRCWPPSCAATSTWSPPTSSTTLA